jgi:hypothetical protein
MMVPTNILREFMLRRGFDAAPKLLGLVLLGCFYVGEAEDYSFLVIGTSFGYTEAVFLILESGNSIVMLAENVSDVWVVDGSGSLHSDGWWETWGWRKTKCIS